MPIQECIFEQKPLLFIFFLACKKNEAMVAKGVLSHSSRYIPVSYHHDPLSNDTNIRSNWSLNIREYSPQKLRCPIQAPQTDMMERGDACSVQGSRGSAVLKPGLRRQGNSDCHKIRRRL